MALTRHGSRLRQRPGARGALLLAVLAGVSAASPPMRAQTSEEQKTPARWSNSTELSLVVTEGNSISQSVALKDTLGYKSDRARSRFRFDALRTTKSDDPFRLVEPGLTFLPGETPQSTVPTVEVRPSAEPDVERYFFEGRYDRNIRKITTWNAGASWDRNEDAGILNRYIVFGGLGTIWRDREDLKFNTSYGLSVTYREEEIKDPEKEQRFLGTRLSSDFKDKWGASTTYDNEFTFNINMKDLSDYYIELVQGLAVSMSKRLSLKVSLQFQYSSEPALKKVDVIARVILIDPDGIPGSGDEFFQTVDSGGYEVTVGEDSLRKLSLDTTFRTSLLITF